MISGFCRGEWDVRPSGLWSCADWQLSTDVSGQTASSTFKSQALWSRKMETMSSRNVGEWDLRPSAMWSCADWQLITDVSGQTIRSTFKSQAPWPMNMEMIWLPETSVRSPTFLDVELSRLAVNYRCFRRNYRVQLQESSILLTKIETMSSRNVGEWDIHPSAMWSCTDWQLITDISGQTVSSSFESQASWPIKMDAIYLPETSVSEISSLLGCGAAQIGS